MKNRHTASLDRQLRLHGETVQLQRVVGSSRSRLNLPGLVKTFGSQQLVGAVTQTNYLVVISPSHLRRWSFIGPTNPPGAATVPLGTGPAVDEIMPTKSDYVILRGAQKAIQQVDAIYEAGEIVRIELKVLG